MDKERAGRSIIALFVAAVVIVQLFIAIDTGFLALGIAALVLVVLLAVWAYKTPRTEE